MNTPSIKSQASVVMAAAVAVARSIGMHCDTSKLPLPLDARCVYTLRCLVKSDLA